jgi:NAD(P)H-dependent flavin oxidoreductase YrpB (nitropropane dioxygenase family)
VLAFHVNGGDALNTLSLPQIIQGGMGVGVSCWTLARAVSSLGQLGVVSGTALDSVMARRLQLGDPGGHLRRALAAFPLPDIAQRIMDRYFRPEGKADSTAYAPIPLPGLAPARALQELTVAATFAEVFLAKEGHGRPVGLNLLEKIQTPTLWALFGAMLAGVDYVLMGAGIPRQIPGIMDQLVHGQPVELRLDVADAAPESDPVFLRLDPSSLSEGSIPTPLKRPEFLAIVTSPVLAEHLLKKASGIIAGFIVETPIAGGHNAPPRGKPTFSETGEPIYGPRDEVDFSKFRALGKPFWLAGGYGRPGRLAEAKALGAVGIQVGTAFAFCDESGLRQDLKDAILKESAAGTLRVFTDPKASPTGFPFKLVRMVGTSADPEVYAQRVRVCDVGLLRQAYSTPEGGTAFRCPAEPVADYVRKGGKAEDAEQRQCLCNGLLAAIGLGQQRAEGQIEPPILTAGDDAQDIAEFLTEGRPGYTAAEVIQRLLA